MLTTTPLSLKKKIFSNIATLKDRNKKVHRQLQGIFPQKHLLIADLSLDACFCTDWANSDWGGQPVHPACG